MLEGKRRTAGRWIVGGLLTGLAICGLGISAARARANAEPRFLTLTNEERSSRGIGDLSPASDLAVIARRHSHQMAVHGHIFHNLGLSHEVKGEWTSLSENVGSGADIDSIHEALMQSAPHRASILGSQFNEVGIGVAIRGSTMYVTEVFALRTVKEFPTAAPARGSHPVVTRGVQALVAADIRADAVILKRSPKIA